MKKTLWIALLSVAVAGSGYLALAGQGRPAEQPRQAPPPQAMQGFQHELPEPDMDKVAYAIGRSIGSEVREMFQRYEFELDQQQLTSGLNSALAGEESELSEQEIQMTLMGFQQKVMQKEQEIREREAAEAEARNEAFLEQHREQEGVEVTASGLQYRIIEQGEGDKPQPSDQVTVHYTGRLTDGEVFDDSRRRGEPATFVLDQVIPGWTEGMQLIGEGGRIELAIPARLAYGAQGRHPVIPPHSVLLFEVELIDVESRPEQPAQPQFPTQPPQPGQPGQPAPPPQPERLPQ